MTGAQAAGEMGLQVLAPSNAFSCDGVVTGVSIRADSGRGDEGFVFQIWRPGDDGTFSLTRSLDSSGSTQRAGEKLMFNTSIPVRSGDVIGYWLKPVMQGEQLHFILDNSNASEGVEIYWRDTAEVPCQISPCDGSYTLRVGFAPFISVEFGEPY